MVTNINIFESDILITNIFDSGILRTIMIL